MERHSRRTENWFDTVILTGKNRPRNLLLSTRRKRTAAESELGSERMCPKCGSNHIQSTLIDDSDPKQPIIHCVCESCDLEWVE